MSWSAIIEKLAFKNELREAMEVANQPKSRILRLRPTKIKVPPTSVETSTAARPQSANLLHYNWNIALMVPQIGSIYLENESHYQFPAFVSEW